MAGLDMWALYFLVLTGLACWPTGRPAPPGAGWMTMMALLLAGVALAVDFRAHCRGRGHGAVPGGGHALDRVRSFTGVSPLVQLGQMSYSVFLVHFAVCLLVNAVVSHLWPASPVLNALGMLLAFTVAGRRPPPVSAGGAPRSIVVHGAALAAGAGRGRACWWSLPATWAPSLWAKTRLSIVSRQANERKKRWTSMKV